MRCWLLPTCNNPETDVATPTDGEDPNVAWCLWKRQARKDKKLKNGQDADNKGPERVLVRFPWNDACRNDAKTKSEEIKVPHKCRAKCDVCKQYKSRAVCVAQAGRNH